MTTLINICGAKDVDDPNYRYQMPKLTVKLEGRGNGSKTCLPNLPQLAQALHRSKEELHKGLGIEIGCLPRWDGEGRPILNGHHSYDLIFAALRKYIEQFVLCSNCHVPEVSKYKIKGGKVLMNCMACGQQGEANPMHKRVT